MDINESANPTNIPKNHTLKFRYDDEISSQIWENVHRKSLTLLIATRWINK